MEPFLATLFIVVGLLLIVVVLLQKGRGGGLGGAFGGAGSSAFGTRTGDVFTLITIMLVAAFLMLAIVTTWYFRPEPTPVQTPTFVPAPGPISQGIRVAIQCRAAKAKLYYTLDGSDPGPESLEHDGTTVPVRPGQTLKAMAVLRGWDDSEIAVGEYPDATKLQPATTSAPATSPAATTQATP